MVGRSWGNAAMATSTVISAVVALSMLATPVERDELSRLVREVPDEQVPRALAELRKHLQAVLERSWPPAWFGIAAGDGSAVGTRSEEFLAEGFGR